MPKIKPKKSSAYKNNLVVYKKEEKHSHLTHREKTTSNFLDSLDSHGGNGIDRMEMLNTLLEKGYVNEEELAKAFARKYSLEHIDNLEDYKISPEVISLIPQKLCQKYTLIPLAKVDKTLVVVFSDPSNIHIKDNISMVTGCRIQPVVASRAAIRKALDNYYDNQSELNSLFYEVDKSSDLFGFEGKSLDDDIVDLDSTTAGSKTGSAAVIQLVNLIFSDAIRLKSSDIHVEIYERSFRIRYRIDGVLHEKHNLPKESAAAIVSRIKVISNMDISEKRKPQDARLKVRVGGAELNLRVNSTPTVNGEKIALRILDDSALKMDVESLNMMPEQMNIFQKALFQPQGLILITGPTGSGKTTTIYSGLIKLNTSDRNISTVEDPVEFRIQGINQVQVNPKVQLNFSTALRAFLRQDPDIILVGEIRDIETAEIAFKASATGHLVLSTLHTNDTASSLTRLLSMGVPAYSVADNTSLILSQRLLRKVCKDCSRLATNIPPHLLIDLGVPREEVPDYAGKIYEKGSGCSNCNDLGYRGRFAVYEVMQITPAIKTAIFNKASPKDLKRNAVQRDGMKTLRQSALGKLKEGLTSIEEVIRTTLPD